MRWHPDKGYTIYRLRMNQNLFLCVFIKRGSMFHYIMSEHWFSRMVTIHLMVTLILLSILNHYFRLSHVWHSKDKHIKSCNCGSWQEKGVQGEGNWEFFFGKVLLAPFTRPVYSTAWGFLSYTHRQKGHDLITADLSLHKAPLKRQKQESQNHDYKGLQSVNNDATSHFQPMNQDGLRHLFISSGLSNRRQYIRTNALRRGYQVLYITCSSHKLNV